ncbi:MAG: hypothetical protein IT578_04225 [Verrucomicrobiae bacterium]|nr:hypothetical protein [Verrucomicrobiae bacterium]
MPAAEPIAVVDIVLTEEPNGRWRARGWDHVVRRMRNPHAAVNVLVNQLFTRNRATRSETVYIGPGTNYGQAGLYQCRLFREPQQLQQLKGES